MSVQCSIFGVQWIVRPGRCEVDRSVLTEDGAVLVAGETGGVLNHSAEHFPDFLGQRSKVAGFLARNVTIVRGDDDPMLRFKILPVRVAQFARKMFRKTAFGPGLGNLRAHAPRSPAPLIGQRIGLFSRKSLRQRKNLPSHRSRSLINHQVGEGSRKVHTRPD
jgi:hypothetical protein